MFHLARGVADRVEHRDHVGAVLRRAINLAIGVEPWVAPISRDGVVQVGRRLAPVPQRDYHVALDAGRTLRLGERQFSGRDPIGPVAKQVERFLGVEPIDIASHEHLCAASCQPPRPGVRSGLRSVGK